MISARVTAATIAAASLAAFAGTTGAHAAPAAARCKPLSASGLKLQWSVIGDVSCQEAKPWLLKILGKRGAPDAQAEIANRPKGFHCKATNNRRGIPSVGACYTGTAAFPKNGFQWFG